jgi:hypothetical protein
MNTEKTMQIVGSMVMFFGILLRTFLPNTPEYLIVSAIVGCTGYLVLNMSLIINEINKKCGQHDSMIVIFKGKTEVQNPPTTSPEQKAYADAIMNGKIPEP